MITSQEFVSWKPFHCLLTDQDVYEGIMMMNEIVDVHDAIDKAVIATDIIIAYLVG